MRDEGCQQQHDSASCRTVMVSFDEISLTTAEFSAPSTLSDASEQFTVNSVPESVTGHSNSG